MPLLLSFACGDKSPPKADPQVVAAVTQEAEGLKQEESDIFARRDELTRERKKISTERAALSEKRKQVAASGGSVADVDAEEEALSEREQALLDQENQLATRFEGLVARYEKLAVAPVSARSSGAEDVARREAALAVREKDVARREERLGGREADLAAREKAQAKREKDTCGTGSVTTIVREVDPKGSKYGKRDVEPVLSRARRKMNDKGLLASDLPEMAQGLEAESVAAMKDGDYGKAKFAADQLVATVESVKIDRAFIAAKIGRLNNVVKGKTLGAGAKKEVDELFRNATSDYGDGRFAAANGKLNKIYALVR